MVESLSCILVLTDSIPFAFSITVCHGRDAQVLFVLQTSPKLKNENLNSNKIRLYDLEKQYFRHDASKKPKRHEEDMAFSNVTFSTVT